MHCLPARASNSTNGKQCFIVRRMFQSTDQLNLAGWFHLGFFGILLPILALAGDSWTCASSPRFSWDLGLRVPSVSK
jgi:hypothetical protein